MMRSFHPAAADFPLMSEVELADLASDISAHGQRLPILLDGAGRIIDGRNRYLACRKAGVEPTYETVADGDVVRALVRSLNVYRRHLSASQRAQFAVDSGALETEERKARERQAHGRTAPGKTLPEEMPEASDTSEAREHVAAEFGTNPRYVSDAKALRTEAPDLADEVKAGAKSIPQATDELKRRRMGVHYSTETPEWYTPPHVIDAVVVALGGIDLDPCSNRGEPNVPALRHMTEDDDGLSQDWIGRVYMNPPYGDVIKDWTAKLSSEHRAGRVTEAIALVPARTDTRWFHELRDHARCFIGGRLKFSNADTSAPFPSVAVYFGDDVQRFAAAFADLGDTYERVEVVGG